MLPWLLLVAWIQPCYSHSLYAYATDRTTQVGIQDPSTGEIWYSNCNSEDTPIFPLDKPNILKTDNKPRNGTALAAAGWWDTEKIIASIFWQSEDGIIVNGYYECNMTTGKLQRSGEYTISLTAKVESVHNESGLAVNLLGGGEDDGYRVFYHNKDRQLKMLTYTDNTNWIDGGTVSQDTAGGGAIGAVLFDRKNMTVTFPKGIDNIATSRFQKTGNWKLASFPQKMAGSYTNNTDLTKISMSYNAPQYTLPGWSATLKALGMATDRSTTRSLFYIGDDNVVHEVIAVQNNWQLAPNRSESTWPLADNPSSGLAVAYNQGKGMTWMYYWSNQTIVQAHKNESNEWEDAKALPQVFLKNETDSSDEDKPAKEDNTTTKLTGFSTGAKAGISAGVAFGALAVGTLIWFFIKRRYKQVRPTPKEETFVLEAAGTPITSPPPLYEKDTYRAGDATSLSELTSETRPVQLDNPSVVYELP
ncbi:hypothetical protein BKA59DRAFT_409480 [Fusarium tricinctum]|uniref:Uncharacterized protein n=1 Tax=Fusarium tricinctum TaxID=61284 RepID=A0A8K0W5I7_9HYPO|nr:hypothetical protein BKA59DRAFT_409480 [Fusarium tricinctum]